MSLADDLLAPLERLPHRGARCTVAVLYERLAEVEPGAEEALRSLIADDRWSGMDIERRMHDLGYELPGPAVNRHRRKDCKCP